MVPLHRLAASCLFLSGMAALIYQVAWVRLLGLSMGSTSASVSTVISAFFLGMALGSFFAGKLKRRDGRDLAVYLGLELGIAVCGLASLPVLLNLDWLVTNLDWLHAGGLGPRFLVATVLLVLPTSCMGATFPVMSALLLKQREDADLGRGFSWIYALNTAGAMSGALLTGFVLVPTVGLDGAIYVAATANLWIVISCARGLLRGVDRVSAGPASERQESGGAQAQASLGRSQLRGQAVTVICYTGVISLAVEVAWTKYLSIFTGTTVYGFASILAIFLGGITLGSLLLRSRLNRMVRPELWVITLLLGLGASLFLTRAGFSFLPDLNEELAGLSSWQARLAKFAAIGGLLLGPTILLGALFPLCLSLICVGADDVKRDVGWAYGLNTLAGIVGSLGAGFWIIPNLGTDFVLLLSALFTCLLPLVFLVANIGMRLRLGTVLAVAATIGIGAALPGIDYERLIDSVDYRYDEDARSGKRPQLLFLREGKAGVISLVTYDGIIARLQNNGLNESELSIAGDEHTLTAESLLSLVPYLIHPSPKTAFVVGFGGGTTTRSLTYTDLERIRVVELEPAIIEAVRSLSDEEVPALADSRVELSIDDARHALLLDETRYDLIVSQPSHPWIAGAGNLFTLEFFEIVESRLSEGGVFGQWVNLFNMDSRTLASILMSFYSVFPEGFSFANLETGDLLLFGSEAPLVFDMDLVQTRMEAPGVRRSLASSGVTHPAHLVSYFALSRNEMVSACAGAIPNTDLNLLSEMRLAGVEMNPSGDQDPYVFLRRAHQMDLLPYLREEQAVSVLEELAEAALTRWKDTDLAARVAHRLEFLDAPRAAKLKKRIEALTE